MADSDCSVVTRLYPVVPGNARLTVENEITVGGYLFPKQVRHTGIADPTSDSRAVSVCVCALLEREEGKLKRAVGHLLISSFLR